MGNISNRTQVAIGLTAFVGFVGLLVAAALVFGQGQRPLRHFQRRLVGSSRPNEYREKLRVR